MASHVLQQERDRNDILRAQPGPRTPAPAPSIPTDKHVVQEYTRTGTEEAIDIKEPRRERRLPGYESTDALSTYICSLFLQISKSMIEHFRTIALIQEHRCVYSCCPVLAALAGI